MDLLDIPRQQRQIAAAQERLQGQIEDVAEQIATAERNIQERLLDLGAQTRQSTAQTQAEFVAALQIQDERAEVRWQSYEEQMGQWQGALQAGQDILSARQDEEHTARLQAQEAFQILLDRQTQEMEQLRLLVAEQHREAQREQDANRQAFEARCDAVQQHADTLAQQLGEQLQTHTKNLAEQLESLRAEGRTLRQRIEEESRKRAETEQRLEQLSQVVQTLLPATPADETEPPPGRKTKRRRTAPEAS